MSYQPPTPIELQRILWALGDNGRAMTQKKAAELTGLNSGRMFRHYLSGTDIPFSTLFTLIARAADTVITPNTWRDDIEFILNP